MTSFDESFKVPNMSQDESTNVNQSFTLPEEEKEALLKAFPQGVIALDLETTGLSPLCDRIIELSAIKLTPKGISTFDQLINPQIPISEITIKIHGITDEMVKNEPTIGEVLPGFVTFMEDLPLIGHNAKFDIGFIVFNMHHLGLTPSNNKVFCSCQFSRAIFKAMPNHKLGTLAEKLGIALKHHEAFDDACASLRIFAKGLVAVKNEQKELAQGLKESQLFLLSDFIQNNEWELPERLKLIGDCVGEQKIIELLYSGGSHKGIFRPVRPIGLLPMPGGPVLYGHCLLSNTYKSFSLSKIRNVRLPSVNDQHKWQETYEAFRLKDLERQNNPTIK